MKNSKNKQLTVSVIDGALTIEIGVHTLVHAIKLSDRVDTKNIEFVDNLQFSKEVAFELENEHYSTGIAIHNCLDLVAERVLESGTISVKYDTGISLNQRDESK